MQMSKLGLVLVIAAVLIVGAGTAYAIRLSDTLGATSRSDNTPPKWPDSPLHEARLDAAKKSGVPAKDVRLVSIRAAGFDGCLGVYLPNSACTMQLIGGYIAVFEAQGKEWRYHFGGDRWVATEPQPQGARIDDGQPVPPELAPDLIAVLTEYARRDAALAANINADGVVVLELLPNFCPPTAGCVAPDESQALLTLRAKGEVHYLVTPDLQLALTPVDSPVERVDDAPLWAQRSSAALLQDELRADLAGRLHVADGEISTVALHKVTWPDGCLGVREPGKVCSQALVPGWQAVFRVNGEEHSYHGAGEVDPSAKWVLAE